MKKKYYDITNLLHTGAQYLMLLGQRSNGKSYQVKKTVLEAAYNEERWFVYLRRWASDNKTAFVQSYFGDMDIPAITHGEWEYIKVWRGFFYFCRSEGDGENLKEIKSQPIGRYCALNIREAYKSNTFVNYDYIIYEEFITDKVYLTGEPAALQQFVSTVARDRKITVFLVGNTLSRVCPYFAEWSLENVLRQKIGTIEIYHYHVSDGGIIDLAVERCESVPQKNRMFFGNAEKQIVAGEWDTQELPHLPRNHCDYDLIYELLIEYQKFTFVMQLLLEPREGGLILFVYPFAGKRKIIRKITNIFSDLPYITSRLDISRRPEKLITDCMRMDKICYSDNLTGTDFQNVCKSFKFF